MIDIFDKYFVNSIHLIHMSKNVRNEFKTVKNRKKIFFEYYINSLYVRLFKYNKLVHFASINLIPIFKIL